jgi:hypothetical protein
MAIFHLDAKIISRGKGQSAIAAAAYRSGEPLRDEQTGEAKSYQARAERIQFTDIMAPKDAPEWAHDRNQLWNEAERAEKRKDAQLAREFEISLPHEMTDEQRQWLIKDYAREQFVRRGYAVDIAIHAPDKDSDDRNYHAHLMVTMRRLGPDGFTGNKDRTLNTSAQLSDWREKWADLANRHLERHGHDARIDHRSLEAQGIDREPTVHVGYAGKEMAARGAQSDRMDALKDVLARNDIRVELRALDGQMAALERDEAKARAASLKLLAKAARADAAMLRDADRRALENPSAPNAERGYADRARKAAQEIRQERRDDYDRAQQDAWRKSVAENSPDKIKPADVADKGLKVFDAATGTVTKLSDYVTNFLAGSAVKQDQKTDMAAFVSDPAARKAQQLARFAEMQREQSFEKTREAIRWDVEAGRNLKSEDIQNLPRQRLEEIKAKGDDFVRQMIESAEKDAAKGYDRERER